MDFLTDDEIKAKQEEIQKKEQEFGGDKREKVPGGVHNLFLCKVECEASNKGATYVRLTYNKDKDQKKYRDLHKVFKFDPKTPDKLEKNKGLLIEHFYKGFGYTFKGGDLKSVVSQAIKFEGKNLRAAVQVKQKLFHKYREDEEGNKTAELIGIIITDYSEIYYVGRITEELKMKQEKRYIKLSEEDLQEYEDHVRTYPERYDANGKLKNEEGSQEQTGSGQDDWSSNEGTDQQSNPVFAFNNQGDNPDDLPW